MSGAGIERHLPLMQVLAKLKHYERQIVVDHLDEAGCKALKVCLKTVLRKKTKVPESLKPKLGRCFKQHRHLFAKLLADRSGGSAGKKTLARLGGNPLALILSTAIPLLLDLIRR